MRLCPSNNRDGRSLVPHIRNHHLQILVGTCRGSFLLRLAAILHYPYHSESKSAGQRAAASYLELQGRQIHVDLFEHDVAMRRPFSKMH
jgi:hypothetical protein